MDALAFEADGKQETLHACGHDANSAILLGLAESTLDKSPERGSLILLFQPAEETLEGALRVLGSGVLEGVEEMIGIHLRPKEEASLGEATPALVHGAHGARPHQGVNAVEAALLSLNAVKNLAFDPRIPHSVKVTDFHGGTGVFNIIPPKARFTLDIRCQSNELMELARRKLSKAVAAGECTGAHVECDFSEGSPAASYAPETVELAKRAIVKVLGSAIPSISTPGSEDFHFYSVKGGIKTAYIGLGADLKPGLHRREMTFSHQVLSQGVAILKEIVLERLGLS
jgi:amidohydrolase